MRPRNTLPRHRWSRWLQSKSFLFWEKDFYALHTPQCKCRQSSQNRRSNYQWKFGFNGSSSYFTKQGSKTLNHIFYTFLWLNENRILENPELSILKLLFSTYDLVNKVIIKCTVLISSLFTRAAEQHQHKIANTGPLTGLSFWKSSFNWTARSSLMPDYKVEWQACHQHKFSTLWLWEVLGAVDRWVAEIWLWSALTLITLGQHCNQHCSSVYTSCPVNTLHALGHHCN